MGAFSQSLVVATSYATLGINGVLEAVMQCEWCVFLLSYSSQSWSRPSRARTWSSHFSCLLRCLEFPSNLFSFLSVCLCSSVVICNRNKVESLVKTFAKLPAEHRGRLTTVIYTNLNCAKGVFYGDEPPNLPEHVDGEELPPLDIPLPEGLKIFSLEELIKMGQSLDTPLKPPTRDNIAVVMYTSGSTGKPKGVVIGHKNLSASVSGLRNCFLQFGELGKETFLAYLPTAHILELVGEITMVCMGQELGYADPRTLASTGACRLVMDPSTKKTRINHDPSLEVDKAPGAIQQFRPTVLIAVPKIWDIMMKGAVDKVGQGSCLQKMIFETAYSACHNASSWRYCPLLSLIFKSIGTMFGGRLKIGISGGGPLSADVQSFVRTAFNTHMVQGYALTETCCAGTVQLPSDNRNGVVGGPLSSVEIKLVSKPDVCDCKQKPYLVDDTYHHDGTACAGRGEVFIRGPSVSLGYLAKGEDKDSLNKKTKEDFSSEAPNQNDNDYDWFHTGDIGIFLPDGSLKLVDRVKNLVKLKGGEYISIESMESVYSTSTYVNSANGGCMVYGDGGMDKAALLVQANMPAVRKYAKEQNIEGDDETLCRDEKVLKEVFNDLLSVAKKDSKITSLEYIAAVHLISGLGSKEFPGEQNSPFTPDNRYLTASNKIDRNVIKHGIEVDGVKGADFKSILESLRKTCGANDPIH